MIAIDPYSKWAEFRILPDRSAESVAAFFYEEVVCRFGSPAVVHTYAGTEFRGAFKALCKRLGIAKRMISTIHPRANGLIERFNKEDKAGICRLLTLCNHDNWWDLLHQVIFALRTLHHSATGYSAFENMFKQQPALPIAAEVAAPILADRGDIEEPSAEVLKADLQKPQQFQEAMAADAAAHLDCSNRRMVKSIHEAERTGALQPAAHF